MHYSLIGIVSYVLHTLHDDVVVQVYHPLVADLEQWQVEAHKVELQMKRLFLFLHLK